MIDKIAFAEKRIKELTESGDLKKLSDKEKHSIRVFYEQKSRNRLETARIIYNKSKDSSSYSDYAETVSAAYYSMYYIVHAFLAFQYKTKLRQGLRGVHSITGSIVLYYLVKTKRLAKHLYEEYLNAFETAAEIQNLSIDDFQEKAYEYSDKYEKSRAARETFTYNVSARVEEFHAKRALDTAEEFINTVRQMMQR